MNTIDKISGYNLSENEISCLYECEIINGCGGSMSKGGMNFDEIMRKNLEALPKFDPDKKAKLLKDIKMICYEHDIDFRFKKGFIKSNYIFAKKIFHLLYWTTNAKRFGIAFTLFVLLNKYGKKFYK